ncbi:MAG: WYL domain-containing protein [Bacilli bacterium]|jgi:hypothetical protein|nr:WYL domain-containing protein [Bacilli bacterium]
MGNEGFLIDESYTNGFKQHLNLSKGAWIILLGDLYEFDPEKLSLSGLFNRIFLNFYLDADASISLRVDKKRQELESLFSSEEFSLEPEESKKLYENKILVQYEEELKQKAKSYQKGYGQKIRINNGNISLLRESKETLFYGKYAIGAYLKALFEEYVLLPHYRREQIYFKDSYETILHAIQDKTRLRITFLEESKSGGKNLSGIQYYVSPYGVVQDSTMAFNYLVGYAEKQLESESNKLPDEIKVPMSFMLSRINKISEVRSLSGFISKEKTENLQLLLRQRTAVYLVNKPRVIQVRFTAKGLESFYSQLYLRPQDYEISAKGPDGSVIIVFRCSEEQATAYLFRFGSEAEVIAPFSLRENFIKKYKAALETYSKGSLL